ncbi:MAG: hypothetical protein DMF94_04690, partial [Acidobacteria bacterium]
MGGTISTKGRVTGPSTALHASGDATVNRLDGFDITALTLAGHYDVTVPSGDVALATARVNGRGEFLDVLGSRCRRPRARSPSTPSGSRSTSTSRRRPLERGGWRA